MGIPPPSQMGTSVPILLLVQACEVLCRQELCTYEKFIEVCWRARGTPRHASVQNQKEHQHLIKTVHNTDYLGRDNTQSQQSELHYWPDVYKFVHNFVKQNNKMNNFSSIEKRTLAPVKKIHAGRTRLKKAGWHLKVRYGSHAQA